MFHFHCVWKCQSTPEGKRCVWFREPRETRSASIQRSFYFSFCEPQSLVCHCSKACWIIATQQRSYWIGQFAHVALNMVNVSNVLWLLSENEENNHSSFLSPISAVALGCWNERKETECLSEGRSGCAERPITRTGLFCNLNHLLQKVIQPVLSTISRRHDRRSIKVSAAAHKICKNKK